MRGKRQMRESPGCSPIGTPKSSAPNRENDINKTARQLCGQKAYKYLKTTRKLLQHNK